MALNLGNLAGMGLLGGITSIPGLGILMAIARMRQNALQKQRLSRLAAGTANAGTTGLSPETAYQNMRRIQPTPDQAVSDQLMTSEGGAMPTSTRLDVADPYGVNRGVLGARRIGDFSNTGMPVARRNSAKRGPVKAATRLTPVSRRRSY